MIEERIDAQTHYWKLFNQKKSPLDFGECAAPPVIGQRIKVHFNTYCTLRNTDDDRNSEENEIGAEQQSYFPGDCRLSFHSHVGSGFLGDDENWDVEKKTDESRSVSRPQNQCAASCCILVCRLVG